ncbi:uncharacterized protein LOC110608522 [Manihot esculenta]|uniref:Uncharacterized protein n=2 Tax=Manihot esculenta TaxID=3983 RepID=A0A2C9WEC9_MANES|nr:uncharacterized protein LOC110608522 [Manihot esculenta]KAG8660050.1 hypothetical protein MANES_02G110400v8 [Manihot esculenta]OAY57612.1 hypothetical protein MANES_02G110400v8 [Manihot esculenta]
MKQTNLETESGSTKRKPSIPPPPPPPPFPRFWVRKTAPESVTNQEIAKFWRQKHLKEEDHLLAAIKAAARLRARNLTEEDYKQFEESLKDENGCKDGILVSAKDENKKEVRVGIKDWWTKSKYAYLNQPAIESMDPAKRRSSNYVPNCFSFKPTPLYPTSLGVF